MDQNLRTELKSIVRQVFFVKCRYYRRLSIKHYARLGWFPFCESDNTLPSHQVFLDIKWPLLSPDINLKEHLWISRKKCIILCIFIHQPFSSYHYISVAIASSFLTVSLDQRKLYGIFNWKFFLIYQGRVFTFLCPCLLIFFYLVFVHISLMFYIPQSKHALSSLSLAIYYPDYAFNYQILFNEIQQKNN